MVLKSMVLCQRSRRHGFIGGYHITRVQIEILIRGFDIINQNEKDVKI